MNCSKCQAPNPEGNAFCHACGAPVGSGVPPQAEGRACPRCGVDNLPHMQFCTRCGERLLAEAALSTPPRPTTAPPSGAPPEDESPSRPCSRCQERVEIGARFCKFCGSPTDTASQGSRPPSTGERLQGRVVVILRDGSEGGVYPLEGGQTDVGSREGDIVLRDDPYMAPRHARIERRGDTFALLDLGTTNGIYLRIRRPTSLADADMILIGQQVLRFEITSEAERQVGPAMQHGVMVFGTPEAPRLARLVQYTTEGLARDTYYIHREETIMGREQADIVFSDDPFLSRRHAAIAAKGSHFTLRDLGSSNGTSIRCRREHLLEAGDQFRVGRHLFRFDLMPGGRGAR